jgi:hypothetical protein
MLPFYITQLHHKSGRDTRGLPDSIRNQITCWGLVASYWGGTLRHVCVCVWIVHVAVSQQPAQSGPYRVQEA